MIINLAIKLFILEKFMDEQRSVGTTNFIFKIIKFEKHCFLLCEVYW